MALPVFVKADDNKWYENAVIGEPKKWFVFCDDELPPELVIRMMRKLGNSDRMELYMPVDDLIRHFTLPIQIVKRKSVIDSMFPDAKGRWNGKMLRAVSYSIIILNSLPANLIISFKDVFPDRPTVDGVYISPTTV